MKTKQNRGLFKRIRDWMFPERNIEIRKHIMTAKVKTVNYTPEMAKEIVESYKTNPSKETVARLALQFGKTTRSIVAKLSREGVYKKAEYVAKNGEKPETKETKVAKIAEMLGAAPEMLNGLEAATKATLDMIIDGLSATVADMESDSESETHVKA